MTHIVPDALQRKVQLAEFMASETARLATASDGSIDLRSLLQLFSGVLVETSFLFENPEEALGESLSKLTALLQAVVCEDIVPEGVYSQPYDFDRVFEQGRDIARDSFVEFLEDAYEYHDIILFVCQHTLQGLESAGIPRAESMKAISDFAMHGLVLEMAAQELCDIVIEQKMGGQGWSLADSISGLSGTAGQKLAEWLMVKKPINNDSYVQDFMTLFDPLVHVMTREAVRFGIPAGTDWRFGLAANDCPPNAPVELVVGIEPFCNRFFRAARIKDRLFQAVACAKAAGRMLAVAAGGEDPEMAPVIAKPLAMAALTETYRLMYPNAPVRV